MKVIQMTKPGGPEVLELVERPLPEPAAGEVRVKAQAIGISRIFPGAQAGVEWVPALLALATATMMADGRYARVLSVAAGLAVIPAVRASTSVLEVALSSVPESLAAVAIALAVGVEAQCAGDEDLRRDVEALLAAREQTASLSSLPVALIADTLVDCGIGRGTSFVISAKAGTQESRRR